MQHPWRFQEQKVVHQGAVAHYCLGTNSGFDGLQIIQG
jgi:hypothetical protein